MFAKFAERVLAAVRGRLPAPDVKTLEGVLESTGRRNAVLARGILSALSAGGASKRDTERFSILIGKANVRIERGQKPFTPSEEKEINRIFRKNSIPPKTVRWFTKHLDALLAAEISGTLKKKKRVKMTLPKKKKKKPLRA